MKVRDLAINERGRVVGYGVCEGAYRQKLLRMGLVRGAEFTFLRRAPLGDPVVLRLNGFLLTLRLDEADALIIEGLGAAPAGHGEAGRPPGLAALFRGMRRRRRRRAGREAGEGG